MSDNHHTSATTIIGEINHVDQLSGNFRALYMGNDYSDVDIVIGNHNIPAHKVILASRSEYFRALFYGGMKESSQTEIELKEVDSITAFKNLLLYIYTGHLSLSSIKEETILEVLGLSHQFGFIELEEAISDYLKAVLSKNTVTSIYSAATLYGLSSLANVCCTFIDRHALDILQHESMQHLSASALKEMIARDSFCAQEIDIFNAVNKWIQKNRNANITDILACIRLPLISLQDLLNIVRPSELVSSDIILDAIKARNESKDTSLKYRGFLMPEENVASDATPFNATVIQGEMRAALLDGDVTNYDMEKGFTRHHIDDDNGQGIVIKLGMQCIINCMKLLLWDKDSRAYSYFIEVSMDLKDWIRVVDYSSFLCRSWQLIYFEPRVVKYIRICGTGNTVNRVFHIVGFSCMFTHQPFILEQGILVPKHNVASIDFGACVIEGVCRNRNDLINGDYKRYDWDTGYTCHQLGSGSIVVELTQPYMVDSMRLLLWDIDQRTYSYYIEVSVDQQSWFMVADKKSESCKSWQTIRFSMRPVVFIRIVGTFNTANEVFHCVHFECPASEEMGKRLSNVKIDENTE